MKFSESKFSDFKQLASYICTMCGYPLQADDKLQVVHKFLVDQHPYNTFSQMEAAFTAMAAGRLEEKMDSFKSLTGLSASRVLQAYIREQRKREHPDQAPEGRSFANDITKQLIFDKFHRSIIFNDEITEAEHDFLMEYWISQEYLENKMGPKILTSGAYNYLERKGYIRQFNGHLQKWNGRQYVDICPWTLVENDAVNIKRDIDTAIGKRRAGLRSFIDSSTGVDLQECVKKSAMRHYFMTLEKEPF